MDPVSLMMAGTALAGIGMSIFGNSERQKGAEMQSQASMKIAGLEQQQDAIRRQAMEIQARRQQMENLRNVQRARSMALAAATNQGAQFGSGLAGGYGQIGGEGGNNALGINQNLEAGEHMFDVNAQISQQKIAYAQAGTLVNKGQGMMSLGGDITAIGNSAAMKSLGGNIFGGSSGGSSSSLGANFGASFMAGGQGIY